MKLPWISRDLDPADIGFLAAAGALAALGVIDPPLAAVIAVGHLLAHARANRLLTGIGEALENA